MFIKNKLSAKICFVLSLIFLSFCFSFTACNKQNIEPEYEEIVLTKDNYSNYIAINSYFTDCTALISSKTNDTYTYYDLYCIGNIVTSKRADCHFSNVQIKYAWTISTWSAYLSYNPTANLDYEGNSHCSFGLSRTNAPKIFFPDSTPDFIQVADISGTVIITKSQQ